MLTQAPEADLLGQQAAEPRQAPVSLSCLAHEESGNQLRAVWQSRFFVLRHEAVYFKTSSSPKPQGRVDAPGSKRRIVPWQGVGSSQGGAQLMLHTPARQCVQGSDLSRRDTWRNAFETATGRLTTRISTTAVSPSSAVDSTQIEPDEPATEAGGSRPVGQHSSQAMGRMRSEFHVQGATTKITPEASAASADAEGEGRRVQVPPKVAPGVALEVGTGPADHVLRSSGWRNSRSSDRWQFSAG